MGTGAKIGIVALVVAGLAAGGYFYWKSKQDEGYGDEGYSGGLGSLGIEPTAGGVLGQQVVTSDSVPITATPSAPTILKSVEKQADGTFKVVMTNSAGEERTRTGATEAGLSMIANKLKSNASKQAFDGINDNDPTK